MLQTSAGALSHSTCSRGGIGTAGAVGTAGTPDVGGGPGCLGGDVLGAFPHPFATQRTSHSQSPAKLFGRTRMARFYPRDLTIARGLASNFPVYCYDGANWNYVGSDPFRAEVVYRPPEMTSVVYSSLATSWEGAELSFTYSNGEVRTGDGLVQLSEQGNNDVLQASLQFGGSAKLTLFGADVMEDALTLPTTRAGDFPVAHLWSSYTPGWSGFCNLSGSLCGAVTATYTPGAPDADSDGIADADDACPLDSANDADNDGLREVSDNCDIVANPNQSDLDNSDRVATMPIRDPRLAPAER